MDINHIRSQFSDRFGKKPVIVRAPGRINLIGEHTDYNDGFVMPAAIDKELIFGISKSGDRTCTLSALGYATEAQFNLDNCLPGEGSNWEQYFRAALTELAARNILVPEGFHLAFGGNIPIGAGLSSSAALCCGFIFALSELFELNLSRKEIALIAQTTEHRIGLNCGIMDQYAVMFGKKDSFMCLDCRSLEFETYSTDLGEYDMVLINSKYEHELVGSAYNDRRKSCEKAVSVIANKKEKVKGLRDVDLKTLFAFQQEMDSITFTRAKFVVEEIDRVMQAKKALLANDIVELGRLLYETHKGLSEEYEVSNKEMDLLVSLTKSRPEILGARMMGGGFGGCTINIVKKENSRETIAEITRSYQAETGIEPEIYFVKANDGVNRIE